LFKLFKIATGLEYKEATVPETRYSFAVSRSGFSMKAVTLKAPSPRASPELT
jgi:hypothetical protein